MSPMEFSPKDGKEEPQSLTFSLEPRESKDAKEASLGAPGSAQPESGAAPQSAARNRLLITGSKGVGKSSAVGALSDRAPVLTDIYKSAVSTLKSQGRPPEETKAEPIELDYGEMILDGDRKLEIYATPGQARFKFIWKSLSKKALGLVVLVDNRRPNPVGDMHIYLENFQDLIEPRAVIVGVNWAYEPGSPTIFEYSQSLQAKNIVIPIVPVDPRHSEDCLFLLSILLSQYAS